MSIEETTASAFARLLRLSGVERAYVYPGGTIAPLIHAIEEVGIDPVVFRSEQGAGFAAIGDSRTSGELAVVLVSSGPGVTNVLTPLADAFYDSVPILIIAGQVSSADLNSGRTVRQRGFQETPTIALTTPIAKFTAQITSESSAIEVLRQAIEQAISARTGPSVIDFPIDLQRALIPFEYLEPIDRRQGVPRHQLSPRAYGDISEVVAVFSKSRRRLVLFGQGARNSLPTPKIERLVRRHGFMAVTSFMGLGAIDSGTERYLGYVGHTGHSAANHAVASCDFLLVLGSRLDVRQTGTEVQDFARLAKVCWVDSDQSELKNPRIRPDFAINLDVGAFLEEFDLQAESVDALEPDESWRKRLINIKEKRNEDPPARFSERVSPRFLLEKLNSLVRDMKPIVVTGVGLHQHWVARHMRFGPDYAQFLSSGGHGTMGFDIPAAIGAKLSNPDRPVICIVGDGSAYMNIQELGFLSDNSLDIRIMVVNNGKLGIVSQFQNYNWGKDPTTGSFGGVSLASIAVGFGLEGKQVSALSALEDALSWLLEGNSSRLLEVMIDPDAVISPMLLAGQKMDEMWFKGDNSGQI